jgi:hypothetical protein
MKKLTIIMVVFFVLALATPANAARELPTVGDRIYLPSGDQSFTAGIPFHIMHGWNVGPGELHAIGAFDFHLEIDGIPADGIRYVIPDHTEEPGNVGRIFNFPEGMSGVHTFTGRWYMPCQYIYPEIDCPEPNKSVEYFALTVTITFVP